MTDSRLKRMKLRAWRRGTKEMDLVLGRYADEKLAALDPAALDALEALMDEEDQTLYSWFTGRETPPDTLPPEILAALNDLRRFHGVL